MKLKSIIIVVAMTILLVGCTAGGSNPVTPEGDDSGLNGINLETGSGDSGLQNRILWGYWAVAIDPGDGSVEIVPLRSALFNANISHFLAPPFNPDVLLTIKILPGSDFPSGYVNSEIVISHPFPDLKQFKGFDVRTILMANGSSVSEHDPDIIYSSVEADEPYVINRDGLTRWWNAPEFTDPTPLFSFNPFALGTNPAPSATLNPYKYYADDVTVDSSVADMTTENRGVFSSDFDPHSRNFQIQFPVSGGSPVFSFNIAVDASWQKPDPDGAPDYPVDSFPLGAQCQEAYHLVLDTSGSDLWYYEGSGGGTIDISLEVFDWQAPGNPGMIGGEINAIWVESPILTVPVDIFPGVSVSAGSQPTSSILNATISGDALSVISTGVFPLLGSVESSDPSTYQPQVPGGEGFIFPDGPLAAYFTGTLEVVEDLPPEFAVIQPNGGEFLGVGGTYDILWSPGIGIDFVNIVYSKDDFVTDIHPVASGMPNDGLYAWDPIPFDVSDTVKIRISNVVDPLEYDDSDDYFNIIEGCVFYEAPEYIFNIETDAVVTTGYHPMRVDMGKVVTCRPAGDGQDAWPWMAMYIEPDYTNPVATFQVPGWSNANRPWHFGVDSKDRIFFFMEVDYPQSGWQFDTVYYIDWNGFEFVEISLNSIDISSFLAGGESGATIHVGTNDDLYVITTSGRMLRFDSTIGYAGTEVFNLEGNPDYPQARELDFVYDLENDTYYVYIGYGLGQRSIYKISSAGEVLAEDTDLFSSLLGGWWCGYISGGIGLDGDCRLVVVDGALAGWGCLRFSLDLAQKIITVEEWDVVDDILHPGNMLHFRGDGTFTFNSVYYIGADMALVSYELPDDW